MKSWQRYCLAEPSVNSALPDFARPGATVFDVGASVGELSAMMSRLVGPLGKVVAFEANPNTAARAVDGFVANGLFNVFMVNRAIETVSNRRVTLHLANPNGGVGDTLFEVPWATAGQISVRTLALDDFIDDFGIEPSFLKFDIEGAEALALRGMQRYLSRRKPIIILEQSTNSFEALDVLRVYQYQFVDLHNYRTLRTLDDYPTDCVGVRNVACLHPQTLQIRTELKPYLANKSAALVSFDKESIEWGEKDARLPSVQLEPGRYILDARVEVVEGVDLPIYVGVRDQAAEFLAVVHAAAEHFSGGRVEIPFHLEDDQPIRPAISSAGEFPIAAAVTAASMVLHHVDGFRRRSVPQTVLGV